MYQSHFHLNDRPFASAANPEHYFPAASSEQAREVIALNVERASGTTMLMGGVGSGKTLLCQLIANQFSNELPVCMIPGSRLRTREALLQAILHGLGLPFHGQDEGELRLTLTNHVTGQGCINGILLILDEADRLPLELLEELRVLTNHVKDGQPRVRLVLAGTHALEERVGHPKLESLNQRIVGRQYLENFSQDETRDYISARVQACGGNATEIFTDDGFFNVSRATDGVPRLINQICDHALLMASVDNVPQLDGRSIEEAWADLQQLPIPTSVLTDSNEGSHEGSNDDVLEFGSLDEDDYSVDHTSSDSPDPVVAQLDDIQRVVAELGSDVNEAAVDIGFTDSVVLEGEQQEIVVAVEGVELEMKGSSHRSAGLPAVEIEGVEIEGVYIEPLQIAGVSFERPESEIEDEQQVFVFDTNESSEEISGELEEEPEQVVMSFDDEVEEVETETPEIAKAEATETVTYGFETETYEVAELEVTQVASSDADLADAEEDNLKIEEPETQPQVVNADEFAETTEIAEDEQQDEYADEEEVYDRFSPFADESPGIAAPGPQLSIHTGYFDSQESDDFDDEYEVDDSIESDEAEANTENEELLAEVGRLDQDSDLEADDESYALAEEETQQEDTDPVVEVASELHEGAEIQDVVEPEDSFVTPTTLAQPFNEVGESEIADEPQMEMELTMEQAANPFDEEFADEEIVIQEFTSPSRYARNGYDGVSSAYSQRLAEQLTAAHPGLRMHPASSDLTVEEVSSANQAGDAQDDFAPLSAFIYDDVTPKQEDREPSQSGDNEVEADSLRGEGGDESSNAHDADYDRAKEIALQRDVTIAIDQNVRLHQEESEIEPSGRAADQQPENKKKVFRTLFSRMRRA